jgi:hypothetical protein
MNYVLTAHIPRTVGGSKGKALACTLNRPKEWALYYAVNVGTLELTLMPPVSVLLGFILGGVEYLTCHES